MRVPEDTLVATKAPDDIRGMFHDISPTYDRLNHLLSLNTDKRWRRFVARKLVDEGTRDFLDVCSGTGDLALAFAERVKRLRLPAVIVGSDFTPAMMRIGRRKFADAARTGTTAPHASVGDTLRLPFAASRFDVVGVAFGIRNVADHRAGIAEMARVCRHGGRIAILEFSQPRNPVLRGAYNLYFFRVLPWVGRMISGSRAYTYLPKSVAKFPDGDEFSAMLSGISGGEVQRHLLSFGIATLYVAHVRKDTPPHSG
jgi:demethylmenaquinone methyltransferase / 2-methoxy-6-polyprenyl-1,4-benzoquinol methylase